MNLVDKSQIIYSQDYVNEYEVQKYRENYLAMMENPTVTNFTVVLPVVKIGLELENHMDAYILDTKIEHYYGAVESGAIIKFQAMEMRFQGRGEETLIHFQRGDGEYLKLDETPAVFYDMVNEKK